MRHTTVQRRAVPIWRLRLTGRPTLSRAQELHRTTYPANRKHNDRGYQGSIKWMQRLPYQSTDFPEPMRKPDGYKVQGRYFNSKPDTVPYQAPAECKRQWSLWSRRSGRKGQTNRINMSKSSQKLPKHLFQENWIKSIYASDWFRRGCTLTCFYSALTWFRISLNQNFGPSWLDSIPRCDMHNMHSAFDIASKLYWTIVAHLPMSDPRVSVNCGLMKELVEPVLLATRQIDLCVKEIQPNQRRIVPYRFLLIRVVTLYEK